PYLGEMTFQGSITKHPLSSGAAARDLATAITFVDTMGGASRSIFYSAMKGIAEFDGSVHSVGAGELGAIASAFGSIWFADLATASIGRATVYSPPVLTPGPEYPIPGNVHATALTSVTTTTGPGGQFENRIWFVG